MQQTPLILFATSGMNEAIWLLSCWQLTTCKKATLQNQELYHIHIKDESMNFRM